MFDSVIDFSVKTIVSVLSSSIACRALRFQNEQFLLVGSSISRHGCVELIEACKGVLEKLEERGGYPLFCYFLITSSFKICHLI